MSVKRKTNARDRWIYGAFCYLNPAASYDTILSPPAIQTCNVRFVIWDSDHRSALEALVNLVSSDLFSALFNMTFRPYSPTLHRAYI